MGKLCSVWARCRVRLSWTVRWRRRLMFRLVRLVLSIVGVRVRSVVLLAL